MRKAFIVFAAAMLLAGGTALAGGKAHWGYSGHAGPEHWGELDSSFRMCSEGKSQSPVDLAGFTESDLQPIEFSYKAAATEILNNGHAVQANYAAGSSITVDGRQFELKQFHFHAPSENLIDGKSYPMEAHLVHADKDGNLAVVSVMLEEGGSNGLISSLWKKMPGKEGEQHALDKGLNVADLLPRDKDYYRFSGSLTTPPCTEGVVWLVMKAPVSVSKGQVEEFEHVMHHPNNRPVQPLNARMVLK